MKFDPKIFLQVKHQKNILLTPSLQVKLGSNFALHL